MGASENAEIVRRAYEAFNKADIETLSELVDENASWHTPGRSPIAGDYQGRDAVFAQYGRYGGDTRGTFKAELRQVFTSDDGRVIGLHHDSGERNGKQLDTDCCVVFEVENGRMTSGREHFFDLNNWDEFWSQPRSTGARQVTLTATTEGAISSVETPAIAGVSFVRG